MNSSTSGAKDGERQSKDQLPHVSEEAAAIGKIMGEKRCDGTPATPELEQGTPVSEILSRDKEAQKHLPKVLRDQISAKTGTRSYSTSAVLRQQELQQQNPQQPQTQDGASASSGQQGQQVDPTVPAVAYKIAQATLEAGLKFEMPQTPLPRTENFRRRYEPLVDQFTKLLMKDGKLSVAQKNMAFILDHLRTAPPPQLHPKRRLLQAPPPAQLPLNPVLYLTLIVDSVAPLIKIRQQKGIAGGGAALQIPVPLALRQRRRTAIKWIIDASDKRRDTKFAQRVANELVAVAEGRSSVWERREQVHKIGVAGRSNLSLVAPRR